MRLSGAYLPATAVCIAKRSSVDCTMRSSGGLSMSSSCLSSGPQCGLTAQWGFAVHFQRHDIAAFLARAIDEQQGILTEDHYRIGAGAAVGCVFVATAVSLAPDSATLEIDAPVKFGPCLC